MNYRNLKTNERVEEDESLDYVLKKCGLKLLEVEDTLEQEEVKDMLVEWYFSGNWIEEDENIPDLENDLEWADRIYQENLDRKWGIA